MATLWLLATICLANFGRGALGRRGGIGCEATSLGLGLTVSGASSRYTRLLEVGGVS
ncbi:MAG: hypothetical protein V7K14_11635 [Nostoc sp.]|uniref:hypothetical protein n=1 Tax=unclassified Nostoc TaxID=2593658 RepID=UPI0025EC9BDF|nr:hypothetical protein [Nostoc sp. NMS7]